jgi:hypothetical protein
MSDETLCWRCALPPTITVDTLAAELRIALTRYGHHEGSCGQRRGEPCSCGLDYATTLGLEPPEEDEAIQLGKRRKARA